MRKGYRENVPRRVHFEVLHRKDRAMRGRLFFRKRVGPQKYGIAESVLDIECPRFYYAYDRFTARRTRIFLGVPVVARASARPDQPRLLFPSRNSIVSPCSPSRVWSVYLPREVRSRRFQSLHCFSQLAIPTERDVARHGTSREHSSNAPRDFHVTERATKFFSPPVTSGISVR